MQRFKVLCCRHDVAHIGRCELVQHGLRYEWLLVLLVLSIGRAPLRLRMLCELLVQVRSRRRLFVIVALSIG